MRLCRPALRKGYAFPDDRDPTLSFFGEAAPRRLRRSLNRIMSFEVYVGKAEPFRKTGRQSRISARSYRIITPHATRAPALPAGSVFPSSGLAWITSAVPPS